MAKARVPMNMYVWDSLPALRDMTDGLMVVHAPDFDTAMKVALKVLAEEHGPIGSRRILDQMLVQKPRVYTGRALVYVWGGRT